eukprot:jgi/Tetstr1/453782/TSEL_040734.t1
MDINIPEEQQKAAVGATFDALRGGVSQHPKIRTTIAAGTRLPPVARHTLAAGQRPLRREEWAPRKTITTVTMDINRPEEQHEAAVGATLEVPPASSQSISLMVPTVPHKSPCYSAIR